MMRISNRHTLQFPSSIFLLSPQIHLIFPFENHPTFFEGLFNTMTKPSGTFLAPSIQGSLLARRVPPTSARPARPRMQCGVSPNSTSATRKELLAILDLALMLIEDCDFDDDYDDLSSSETNDADPMSPRTSTAEKGVPNR